jgi:hypothetical protein
MRKVFAIDSSGQTNLMKQVFCDSEGRLLQDLLDQNFELLVGDLINPEDPRKWLLIRREMPVPDPSPGENRWSIDFFFVDQFGMPTFVECKRYKDTQSRREIIGQMLEYAANGRYYWGRDDLIRYADETARKRGEDLEGLLGELQGENRASSDVFFENVQNSLREGQIRLVFFLEEASMELKNIVEFLNNQMESTEMMIVEVKQYQDDQVQILVSTLLGSNEEPLVDKYLKSKVKRILSSINAQGEFGGISEEDISAGPSSRLSGIGVNALRKKTA